MCHLSKSISCDSLPADQEVEDAGTPSRRRLGQAKGVGARAPPERLSVVGSPRLTSPDQPRHDGVLRLQRALHRLHPGRHLAATATHAGRFSVSLNRCRYSSEHLMQLDTSAVPWINKQPHRCGWVSVHVLRARFTDSSPQLQRAVWRWRTWVIG